MVLKGVKGKVTKQYVEAWAYPSKAGLPYRLNHKVFKNYCPLCKRSGTLKWNPKHVPEGEITCGACDADYCAVSGKDKAYKVRGKLKPATIASSSSSTTKASLISSQTKQCELSKAEAKTKAKSLLDTASSKSYNIKIPLISGISPGDYINVNGVEGFTSGNYFIDTIKEDLNNGELDLTLLKGRFHYPQKYEGEYVVVNKNGSIGAKSSSNPFQAKASVVNSKIGITGKSTIEKKIMLKGKKLGTIKKIYKWLMAGSTGKFRYKYYGGHYYKAENGSTPVKSLTKCWKNRFFNCVDGATIFKLMCMGAGIKTINIVQVKYKSFEGKSTAHVFCKNTKTGKYYDVTNIGNISPNMKKVEQIK